jgi:response regulator of citrate/malate metabolism
MSVLQHTSSTVVSILNGISTTANAATQSITSAATGLDMLDAYIQKAKKQQAIDHALEMDTYQEEAIATASAAHQQKMEAILKVMHSDPVRKAHFDEIHSRLSALFAPKP